VGVVGVDGLEAGADVVVDAGAGVVVVGAAVSAMFVSFGFARPGWANAALRAGWKLLGENRPSGPSPSP
jgi:hypothetical protein